MNLGISKSSTSGTTKNKFQCTVHGLANYPTKKCKIYKYFLANHAQPSGTFTAPVAIPSDSGTVSFSSGSNICFRYTGNIPWSREHAAVCLVTSPTSAPPEQSALLVWSLLLLRLFRHPFVLLPSQLTQTSSLVATT